MKKMQGKRKAAATVLAAAVTASLSFGTVAAYGAPYNYDWESGADSTGYSVPYKIVREEEENGVEVGPGVVPNLDSELESGPSVNQSTMSEQYHEDYKIYEESIEGIFFFYSSVANGGITHEPVVLDLPANLTWTVEKDGREWAYDPAQPITERGTYVFRLYGIEDTSVPLSEQKEYRAVFRFRIQEKPPEEETEPESEPESTDLTSGLVSGYESLVSGGLTSGGLYLGPDGLYTGAGAQALESSAAAENESGGENEAASGSAEAESGADGSGLGEGAADGSGEGVADGSSENAADGSGESAADGSGEGNVDGTGADGASGTGGSVAGGSDKTAFTQTYNVSAKEYQVNFNNGTVITSNVPGGFVGPGPVEIFLPEGDVSDLNIYHNDTALTELVSDNGNLSFGENGYYRLEAGGASWSFAIATATSQMDVYPAPIGMKFKEAALDGQALSLSSKDYVLMEEDGQYSLTMEGEEGETIITGILKDTEAPQIQVTAGKGTASIQYLSEDIAEILLEKDGELIEGFSGYSISTPGSYILTVKDAAGNAASTSFNLKYRVNTYGIAAVVLVILVIAGIVVFVIHTKRTVKVR